MLLPSSAATGKIILLADDLKMLSSGHQPASRTLRPTLLLERRQATEQEPSVDTWVGDEPEVPNVSRPVGRLS